MFKNYKFTDQEIADLVNSAIILIDTREKDTFQLRLFNEYCASCLVRTERMKLPIGDYAIKIPKNEGIGIMRDLYLPVVVERKANLDELCVNFSSSDRNRFINEFAKAKTKNLKVYVMIGGSDYSDLVTGNYRSKFNPVTLEANINSVQAKYDNVHFCYVKDIYQVPRFIVNLLFAHLKTSLKNW